ncbi:MAG: hypothetical protein ACR652_24580 [Methylocystis sp.]|uniref:hypothetical protein n=1 Tax=Methylocystis sp. TaxID=1911079 RepID=UPI003DA5ADC0
MKSITDKQRAKRLANGEKFISSTIARKSAKRSAVVVAFRKSEKQRKTRVKRQENERKYGPQLFREFLHASQCLGCGTRQNIQQAHRFTGGMGRKGNWQDTIPLCGPQLVRPNVHDRHEDYTVPGCHASYDAAKQSWSREHNLPARAAFFWTNWERHRVFVQKLRSAE